MKITIVAGARPNFIKIAPIINAIEKRNQQEQMFPTDWFTQDNIMIKI